MSYLLTKNTNDNTIRVSFDEYDHGCATLLMSISMLTFKGKSIAGQVDYGVKEENLKFISPESKHLIEALTWVHKSSLTNNPKVLTTKDRARMIYKALVVYDNFMEGSAT